MLVTVKTLDGSSTAIYAKLLWASKDRHCGVIQGNTHDSSDEQARCRIFLVLEQVCNGEKYSLKEGQAIMIICLRESQNKASHLTFTRASAENSDLCCRRSSDKSRATCHCT